MNLEQVKALTQGQFVRVMVDDSGDRGEELGEAKMPAGTYAKVLEVWYVGGVQGWGVTVGYANGCASLFDEADPEPKFPFETLTPAEAPLVKKLYALESFLDDYQRALNVEEIAPNGDDFNDLANGLELIFAGLEPDPVRLTEEGR